MSRLPEVPYCGDCGSQNLKRKFGTTTCDRCGASREEDYDCYPPAPGPFKRFEANPVRGIDLCYRCAIEVVEQNAAPSGEVSE